MIDEGEQVRKYYSNKPPDVTQNGFEGIQVLLVNVMYDVLMNIHSGRILDVYKK